MAQMRRVRSIARLTAYASLILFLITTAALAQSYSDRRKIVMFSDATPLELQLELVEQIGGEVLHILWLIQSLAILLPSTGADQALAFLLSNLAVTGVFHDLQSVADGSICIIPELPPVPERYAWGLQRIFVPGAHQQWPDLKGTGTVLAILDTGIDRTHTDLRDRVYLGYNARAGENPSDYLDHNGHGTHIAGIIAATENTVGLIGATPKVKLAAVKVLDDTGAGYESDVINGLQYVYSNKIRLVNMSLGFEDDPPPLRKATQRLYNSGSIIVSSAGNRCAVAPSQDDGGGDECEDGTAIGCPNPRIGLKYPAAYSWVLAIGAITALDQVAAYSLTGKELDLVAPGGDSASGPILSTNKNGGYGWGSGTSQAAAHVSGAIGLALQLQPQLTFTAVRSLLQTTSQNLGYPTEAQGAGLVNVKKMLEELQ